MADHIRIYTKRAYEFVNDDGAKFAVPANYIGHAPKWVSDNELFLLAAESGNVEELTTKEMERQAEINDGDAELTALRARGKELGIAQASRMGKEKLLAAIAEKEKELGLPQGDVPPPAGTGDETPNQPPQE